jgi:uncharacterized protein YjbI with pentapeptide repeats
MVVPTDEQIEKWQKRWDKYPGLRLQVASILKGGRLIGESEPDDSQTEELTEVIESAKKDRIIIIDRILPEGDFETIDRYRENEGKIHSLDLRGICFKKTNLNGFYAPDCQLEGASMISCDLTGSVLTGAKLQAANLSCSEIGSASFDEANLEHAILNSGTASNKVYMNNAILKNAKLAGC